MRRAAAHHSPLIIPTTNHLPLITHQLLTVHYSHYEVGTAHRQTPVTHWTGKAQRWDTPNTPTQDKGTKTLAVLGTIGLLETEIGSKSARSGRRTVGSRM